MYYLSQKKATLNYRNKNKEQYNVYMKMLMRSNAENRKRIYRFNKECLRLRLILI